jgi:hypothetical protein
MNKDAVMIVRGFLQLPNLEKKKVVDVLNHYFDELNERESIRSEIEEQFVSLGIAENKLECKCCGRT